MNNDTIYKMYCQKYNIDKIAIPQNTIQKTYHYKLFALRTHSWAFYMVFRGMFLRGFYKLVRFFR
jgi:hypothetical protein